MNLQEQVYSVLVVSAAERFNAALPGLLPESRCDPVRIVTSVSAAKRAWASRHYDIVLINSPLPDDAGTRFAIDVSDSKGTVALLLVKAERYDDVQLGLVPHGVFSLAKPLSQATFRQAFDWMESARERLRKLEKKTVSVEEKMAEIRLVNRAKWLLITELKMEEPQAHRYIEKQAMDRCISRREVAEKIIQTYT